MNGNIIQLVLLRYRSVRLRCACFSHEANADDFGARSFDLAVSTHNYPSERGIEKLICYFTGDLSRSEKSHQQWEFGGASPESG
jgi:hypothetical protein